MQKKARGLSLAKILHTSGINRLINRLPSNNPVRFCHDRAASTLCRLAYRSFSVPRRPHFGEPRASSATADSTCQTTAASAGLSRQGVLGFATKAVVGVEETTSARHPRNGGALASHRLPVVLGL